MQQCNATHAKGFGDHAKCTSIIKIIVLTVKTTNKKTMKKMKVIKNLACLAVAAMASAATISAATIVIPAGGQHTIKDADVNANVPSPCNDPIYRWWRNNVYTMVTTDSITIDASSLTAGQPYTYYRTTRCGACGNQIVSANVEVMVFLCTGLSDAGGICYRTKIYNGVEWMIDNARKPLTTADGCISNSIDRTKQPNDYGLLYSWSCAAQACPTGWVLPTDNDFTNLSAALTASNDWADWNAGASLAGLGINGTYSNYQSSVGYWWSRSASNSAWYVNTSATSGNLVPYDNTYSFSVRCRKQ
jgi:hypothetical protein